MIYINGDQLPINSNMKDEVLNYLKKKQMVLVDLEGRPLNDSELDVILSQGTIPLYLQAIHTSSILRGFKKELYIYVEKVTNFVESVRESEDQSTVITGFTNIVEALLEFIPVTKYLQKELVDADYIQTLTEKVLERAKVNDYEYIIDVIEYELLTALQTLYDEIQEVM